MFEFHFKGVSRCNRKQKELTFMKMKTLPYAGGII